jgi:hypothetical protein
MDASAPDIKDLEDQLDAAERDARALVADLAEERGGWRAETGSWSVAKCLDHLARANRVYLQAMKAPAIRAHEQGRFRRGPATPGFVGRWFVRTMEPPVKAPSKIEGAAACRTARGATARKCFRQFQDFTGRSTRVPLIFSLAASWDQSAPKPTRSRMKFTSNVAIACRLSP